jgi:hypothetical protein
VPQPREQTDARFVAQTRPRFAAAAGPQIAAIKDQTAATALPSPQEKPDAITKDECPSPLPPCTAAGTQPAAHQSAEDLSQPLDQGAGAMNKKNGHVRGPRRSRIATGHSARKRKRDAWREGDAQQRDRHEHENQPLYEGEEPRPER